MQRYRVELCIIVVAALLFFVRTTSASEQPPVAAAKWPRSRIVLSISSSLSSAASIQGDVSGAIRRSVAMWVAAADIRIETAETDEQNVSPKGVRGDRVNLVTIASTAENLSLFPKQAASPAAATRIFVDRRGNITEADVVLNPFVRFSTDGAFGTFDLQATITHEIGHLLGLDHSPAWGSVMFEKLAAGFGPAMYSGVRTSLPEVDGARLRGLYGSKFDDANCCGTVIGRVSVRPQHGKEGAVIAWIEEMTTGRLVAASRVSENDQFEILGVREGSYRLRIAGEFGKDLVASDEAEINVSVADIVRKDFRLQSANAAFSSMLLGSSPQISRLPAILVRGNASRVFLGWYGLDSGIVMIKISGTGIVVGTDDLRFLDYGKSLKVISLDHPGFAELGEGEYSIQVEDSKGVKRFLVGALSIVDQ